MNILKARCLQNTLRQRRPHDAGRDRIDADPERSGLEGDGDCSTPALLAAEALRFGQTYFAQIEPTLTIDPPPGLLQERYTAARQQR